MLELKFCYLLDISCFIVEYLQLMPLPHSDNSISLKPRSKIIMILNSQQLQQPIIFIKTPKSSLILGGHKQSQQPRIFILLSEYKSDTLIKSRLIFNNKLYTTFIIIFIWLATFCLPLSLLIIHLWTIILYFPNFETIIFICD